MYIVLPKQLEKVVIANALQLKDAAPTSR